MEHGGGLSSANRNISTSIALSAASFRPFGTSTSFTPVLWHPSLKRLEKPLKSPYAENILTAPLITGCIRKAILMLPATSSGHTSLGIRQFSMSHSIATGPSDV
ncbi:hypothetical protein HanPSC8_Chr10g0432131 [Helianthus annuus]|nr:hypothetical protein HanPSC8_Chr10g0432131 [Helianthus annuus]